MNTEQEEAAVLDRLRDQFAAAALTGLVAYPGRQGEDNKPEHFARWAYYLADAMLAERNAERG